MSEEKEVQAPDSANVEKTDLASAVEKQEKRVAELEKAATAEDGGIAVSPELNRERDRLRHLRRLQKGNFKEGAEAKTAYAAKAATRRAIQPVEGDD